MGIQPATAAPPHFRPMLIVAKRSPISATAELLFKKWLELSWEVTNYKGHQSRSLTAVNHSPLATSKLTEHADSIEVAGVILSRKFFTNYIANSAFRIHFLWHFAALYFQASHQNRPTFFCTPLCHTSVPHCTPHLLKVGGGCTPLPTSYDWRRPCRGGPVQAGPGFRIDRKSSQADLGICCHHLVCSAVGLTVGLTVQTYALYVKI